MAAAKSRARKRRRRGDRDEASVLNKLFTLLDVCVSLRRGAMLIFSVSFQF